MLNSFRGKGGQWLSILNADRILGAQSFWPEDFLRYDDCFCAIDLIRISNANGISSV